MTRAASHPMGSTAAPTTNNHASSALLSTCAIHALSAATTMTSASNSSVNLTRRLMVRPSAERTQVESFHAAVQRLARQTEALRRPADVAARLAQAGLDHLPARVLGVSIAAARRRLTAPNRRLTSSDRRRINSPARRLALHRPPVPRRP